MIDEFTKRLESLKAQEQEIQGQIQDLSEKLKRCRAGEKSPEPPPTPPKEPSQKNPPPAKPPADPPAKATPPPIRPPQPDPPPEQPPQPPATPPTGRSVGLILECGCDRWDTKAWEAKEGGFSRLRADLSGVMACTESFGSGPLADLISQYQSGLNLIKEIEQWRDLPEQEFRPRLEGIAPKIKAVAEGLKMALEGGRAFEQSFRKCDQAIPQASVRLPPTRHPVGVGLRIHPWIRYSAFTVWPGGLYGLGGNASSISSESSLVPR